jgi:K+-transporting ATPase ATPase A chain
MRVDVLLGWIEKPIYRLLGTDPARGMSWHGCEGVPAQQCSAGVPVWVLCRRTRG